MNTITQLPTKGHIKHALQNLARGVEGLDEIYRLTMKRVDEYGKQILAWIVHAIRPLSTIELQHALAIQRDTRELDEDFLPNVQDLRSKCAGLVAIDEETDVVRLVHFTTQEYFRRTQSQWFPDAQTNITTACVTYLSFDNFKSGYCQSDEAFEQRLLLNKLYDYAARNWGYHARKASTSCQDVTEFLQKQAEVQASSQALLVDAVYHFKGYSKRFPMNMTGLHLVAYFGLEDIFEPLLTIAKFDFDSKDAYGQTPLLVAAENGHEGIVKLLLASEVNVNLQNDFNSTPLLVAASNGHEGVVKLLLAATEVNVNLQNDYNETPLLVTARNGHEGVVKLLLTTSVNVNLQNIHSETPLLIAAKNGHEGVVKLLLATEVNVNLQNNYKYTPLLVAARNGHEGVVKLLLATGKVDVSSKDNNGRTALSQAVTYGREGIIKLLKDYARDTTGRG